MWEDDPQLEAFRALRWSHCDITLKPSQESNSSRNRKVFGIEYFMGMEHGSACRWLDAIKLVAAFGVRKGSALNSRGAMSYGRYRDRITGTRMCGPKRSDGLL